MSQTRALVLINTGSPAAPTAEALKPYLKAFLSDPRIIELPRWLWLPIWHTFILPSRPAKSAERYRQIWTEEGSPLLVHTRQTVHALRERFEGEDVRVEMAMRYGEPSIHAVVEQLVADGINEIFFMPLYAQYATQTTESALDSVRAVMRALGEKAPRWEAMPAFYNEPGLMKALVASVNEARDDDRHLVMSFHGIPVKCTERGDPYEAQCHETAKRLAQALNLRQDQWSVAFQSRFGTDKWLQPYLPAHVQGLAKSGVTAIDVISLSFSADCLETLEELALEVKGIFEAAGGRDYRYLPCVNARSEAIDLYEDLARRGLQKLKAQK